MHDIPCCPAFLVLNDRTAVFFKMTRAEFFCDSIYRYYETGLIGVCGVFIIGKNIEGVKVIVFVYVDLIQYIPLRNLIRYDRRVYA